jgi:hypothetical protein
MTTENSAAAAQQAAEDAREILDPRNGEVVKVSEASDEWLAGFLGWVKALERQARDAKAIIRDEVIARMDRNARWTLPTPAGKLTAPSPTVVDYDPATLRANLQELVAQGTISAEAAAQAVDYDQPKLKVSKAGVNALKRLGEPDVDDAIALATKPGSRNVSLETS